MKYREVEKIVLDIIKNKNSIVEAINIFFKSVRNKNSDNTIKHHFNREVQFFKKIGV